MMRQLVLETFSKNLTAKMFGQNSLTGSVNTKIGQTSPLINIYESVNYWCITVTNCN